MKIAVLMLFDVLLVDLYDEVAAGSLERTRELLSSLESIEDAINRYYRGPNTLLYKYGLVYD